MEEVAFTAPEETKRDWSVMELFVTEMYIWGDTSIRRLTNPIQPINILLPVSPVIHVSVEK